MYFECVVPKEFCCGAVKQVEPNSRLVKVHQSQHEVKKCLTHYLTEHEGYENMGNRQFKKEGKPILIISKKSGMRLRKGKGGSKGSSQSNTRFQAVNFRRCIKAW